MGQTPMHPEFQYFYTPALAHSAISQKKDLKKTTSKHQKSSTKEANPT